MSEKTLAASLAAACLSASALAANAELSGSIGGEAFKPKAVRLARAAEIKEENGPHIETYALEFKSEDDLLARVGARVTIAVRKGELPDGRTFRKLANVDIERQPSVSEGLPEVQGWSMEDRERGFRRSHVFSEQGSVTLVFGKRQGKSLPGSIKLVVPPGKDDKPGTKRSFLEGDFVAVVD